MAAKGIVPTIANGDTGSGGVQPMPFDQWATRCNEEIMALWASLGAGAEQEVTGASGTVDDDAALVIVNRSAPATTSLALPPVADRPAGLPLIIVDYSESVTDHVITLDPDGSETIMRQSTWQLASSAASLATIRLIPRPDLSGWLIV